MPKANFIFDETKYEDAKRVLVEQVIAMVQADYPEACKREQYDTFLEWMTDAHYQISEIAEDIWANMK